jgi:hypothetical protein
MAATTRSYATASPRPRQRRSIRAVLGGAFTSAQSARCVLAILHPSHEDLPERAVQRRVRLRTLHCIGYLKSKKTRKGRAAAAPQESPYREGTQGVGV